MKRVLKWILIGAVLLYGMGGFIVLPYLIEQKAPQIVYEQTKGHLHIGRVAFNPFLFELELDDLHFTPPDRSKFMQLKQLHINFELYSLLLGKIHFADIRLLKPNVNLVYSKEGHFNFEWLRELESSSSPQSSEKSALPVIMIDTFSIAEGIVSYADNTKAKPFEVAVTPIDFTLENVDTGALVNDDDKIRLLAHFHDGGFLDLRSDILSVAPFALKGSVDFESGKLFTGWSYMQEALNLEVADGQVHMHARYDLNTSNLDAIRIDELRFALKCLRVIPKDAHHDIINIKNIVLNDGFAEPMRSLVRLDTLTIDEVKVNANRSSSGVIDWQHYIAKVEHDAASQKPQESVAADKNVSKAWNVLLNHFALNNLHVNFKDEAVTPATTTLSRLDFSANTISSKAQTPLDYKLAMSINETMECASEGNVSHGTLNGAGNFTCKGINLPWFNPYIDQAALSALEKYELYVDSGVSALALNYSLSQSDSINVALNQSMISLDDFVLKEKKSREQLFSIKEVRVDGIDADTAKQDAAIKAVLITSPYVYASLNKEGDMNWNRYIVPKSAAPATTTTQAKSQPWHLFLDRFQLAQGSVHFKDYTLEKGVSTRLSAIDLTANNIDSNEHSSLKYTASMRLNRSGKIKARGSLQHTPMNHSGTLNIANVQLKEFSPYVSKDHYIKLERGTLSLDTSVKYAPSQKGANAKLSGALAIKDFVLENSLDNSVLVGWNKVNVSPFTFEYNPDKLFVKDVQVDAFYTNAIIDANGTMNFAQLSRHPQSAEVNTSKPEEKEEAEAFPVSIVKVTLVNSSANFADYSLPLNFKAYIHDFNGDIYGISSNKKDTSFLEFNGVVNQYGAAKLKGSLNTADIKKFTDLNLVFRNIDLIDMSPYSGKFVGKKIANGKLFLDLNYDIADAKMIGENSIIVKKLELGDAVESPDAIDLPLGLAIALLEDSDGMIDLELPVSGDMDNPEFSYGHIVFKAFFNLLTKAVTAPFSLLGAMLGIDGDALEYVEFEPGSSTILPPEQEKLDKLSKALIKRPKLNLALHGTFNEMYDSEALQHAKLLNQAVQKAKKEGEVFEGEVRKEILEELYEELIGDEARDVLEEHLEKAYKDDEAAFEKKYDEQMVEDLSKAQPVTPEDIKALALKRSEGIKNYLVESKSIDANRIESGETFKESESEGKWIKSKMELVIK